MKWLLPYLVVFSNMADIDLYQDNGDDNPDDGYGLDDGIDAEDAFGTDDNLTPLQKLEKYMESDNVYTRQMVARGLLDTLRAVGNSDEHTTAVLTAMVRLSEDSDPIVRSELMEQVPHISVYCQENRDVFQNAVQVYILPMVVRYLNDTNNQVRKTSQAALLVLLEQELVDREDIEDQVVSVILDLASPDSLDDHRTEAVALMSKMAPLLGRDMTERVFLSRFCEMCCDPLFHVRKVCAANFGEICTVVSQSSAEQQLLPKFYFLCEDGVWGVRKACAECFMAVSCACSQDVRKSDLASLFVNLLCDQSRWVRMAAFQQLGPFISTFADSDLTGIHVAEDGTLICSPDKLIRPEKTEEDQDTNRNASGKSDQVVPEVEVEVVPEPGVAVETNGDGGDAYTETPPTSPTNIASQSQACDTDSNVNIVSMDISDDSGSSPSAAAGEGEPGTVEMHEVVLEDESVEEKRAQHYNNNNHTLSAGTEQGELEAQEESKEEITGDDDTAKDDQSGIMVSDDSNIVQNTDDSSIPEAASIEETKNNDEETNPIERPAESSSSGNTPGHVHIHLDNINNFNSFQYWRTPLPALNLDLELVDGAPTNLHVMASVKDEQQHKVYASEMNIQLDGNSPGALSGGMSDLSICDKGDKPVIETARSESVVEEGGLTIHTASVSMVSEADETAGVSNIGSTHVLGQQLNETTMSVIDGVVQNVEDLSGNNMAYIDSDFSTSPHSSFQESLTIQDDATLAQQQDIVPQSLLENYLGMIDPSRAQTVDTEITKYCAYNLPAVAYTLGRENWHCIKNLYETLAADMQWKVRRTLAFSIHELAVILGENITHRDLVPVFDGFLKDLDEVRIGILRHLADFLRLLSPDVRRQYLIKVQDFMNVDNQRNWRFRLELAEQLVLISELFSAQEISEFLLPLAMALAEDKVAEVRIDAFRLMSVMLRRMSECADEKLVQYLVNQLLVRFARNQKWAGRQIFAQLCLAMVQEESVSPERFAKDILPSLLALKDDNVPNVRIAVAKTLALYVETREYSDCDTNPHKEALWVAVGSLRSDSDRDVRFFSSSGSGSPPETTSLDTTTEEDLEPATSPRDQWWGWTDPQLQ